MKKELLEERKQIVYELICDDLYVPMKAKEIAILMNVPKAQRHELQEVLDALVAEGKVEVSTKGKYTKGTSRTSPVYLPHMPAVLDLSLLRVRTKIFLFRKAIQTGPFRMMLYRSLWFHPVENVEKEKL